MKRAQTKGGPDGRTRKPMTDEQKAAHRERVRRWRERTGGEYDREYRVKNADKIMAYSKAWKIKNREAHLGHKRKYRAGIHLSSSSLGAAALLHIRRSVTTDQMYRDVMVAIPAKYHIDTREDIATEAIILMLDGTATNAAEAVALGIKQHFRLFSKFNTISLDEDRGDGFRLIDRIATDHMEAFI